MLKNFHQNWQVSGQLHEEEASESDEEESISSYMEIWCGPDPVIIKLRLSEQQ